MCFKNNEGTYDLYGENSIIWQDIINKIINICKLYNFKYIRTPIFESTELYFNLIGKNTDIISKELYNFKDKFNNKIALRPEGTTGIIRSYLEHKLYKKEKISKLYYYGPMFRQENIEKCRYREFQQFGVELFNSNDYKRDVEVICLAIDILKTLGLNDIILHINNLGSKENINSFEKSLKSYFKKHLNDLCTDCQKRYKNNPIRILDCKIDKRKEFVLKSPKIEDFVDNESKKRFKKIIDILKDMKIEYIINKNLVRGLNYYTNTVFEIKTKIPELGYINTICGGGRYNSIIKDDNNKNIPAIGFAIGLERLINVLNEKNLIALKKDILDFNILFDDIKLISKIRNLGFVSEYNSTCKSKYIILKKNKKYLLTDNINNYKIILNKKELIDKLRKLK